MINLYYLFVKKKKKQVALDNLVSNWALYEISYINYSIPKEIDVNKA